MAMSQADLARRAEVAVRQIARYEAGEQQPALNVAQRIASALQISLDELAGAYTDLIDLTGDWYLARRWANDADEVDIMKIYLAERSYRISMASKPDESEAEAPSRMFGELRLIDTDALIGSFAVNRSGERRSGTLLLSLQEGGLAATGLWAEISRPARRLAHGAAGMAKTPEDADRLVRGAVL